MICLHQSGNMEDQKHPDHVYTRYNIWMKNPLFWMENGTLLQQNHSFSRKMVPCCNKTIVFRVKLYLVATKPWFFEENCTLLQQNNEFSGATKPDKPCPWFGSWTPKNIKNTSVPLKRECFVETLDPEKHKNYEVCSNREHWIWILDTRKP